MTHSTDVKLAEPRADLTLPSGCVVCGGDLSLRLTPGDAWSFCPHCHWISRPAVERGAGGMRVGLNLPQLA